MQMSRTFLTELLDFLFPPHCHLCSSFIPDAGSVHICQSCMESFVPVASPYCVVCGIPFAGVGENHLCGTCTSDFPSFDTARASFVYEGGVKDLLHTFKYTPKPQLRKPLALLTLRNLTEHIHQTRPDMVIPVPLHRKKLQQRGFNQAVLLGEVLSRQWNIPLERSVLQRIRWTEPQVRLSGAERRQNVKGAFAVSEDQKLNGKCVLLIDDVFTTGSTLNECAKTIKAAGAKLVHAVSVARTV